MTLSTVQPYTAGQVIDLSRSVLRQRLYAGVVTSYTLTWTAAATGVATYLINGKTVTDQITVGPDDSNTTASKMATAHVDNVETFRIANATAATNVTTVSGRTSFDVFTVSGESFTGAGNSVVLADTTPVKTDLPLGVFIAFDGDGGTRKLTGADAASAIAGLSIEMPGSELKLATGDPSDDDVYEVGVVVDMGIKGEFPVQVETDVVVGDPVWVRRSAGGTETIGAGANADGGGGNFIQLTNAAWTGASYLDDQGRKLALVTINQP